MCDAMKTSQNGLDIIRVAEGCRLKAYLDGGGVWTIGYGLTSAAGIIKVGKGLTITQEEAETYLEKAVEKFERAVLRAITVPLSQNQFDACVSLAYNIGETQFTKSSVARYCNAGDFGRAADAFLMWVKDNGKTIPGLVGRRAMERTLFLKQVPAPPAPPPPDVETTYDLPPYQEGWLMRLWHWFRR